MRNGQTALLLEDPERTYAPIAENLGRIIIIHLLGLAPEGPRQD
jgi:hypothetical protein